VILEQIPPSPVRAGTTNIRFRVTSARDGYLVLLSVSDKGEVVQLFPNAMSTAHAKDGRIGAGHPIVVPDPSYRVRFDATSVTKGNVLARWFGIGIGISLASLRRFWAAAGGGTRHGRRSS
jgi:metacaspase-1